MVMNKYNIHDRHFYSEKMKRGTSKAKVCIYVAATTDDVDHMCFSDEPKHVCVNALTEAISEHETLTLAAPLRFAKNDSGQRVDSILQCLRDHVDVVVCCLTGTPCETVHCIAGMATALDITTVFYGGPCHNDLIPSGAPIHILEDLMEFLAAAKPHEHSLALPRRPGYYEDADEDHMWWEVRRTSDSPPTSPKKKRVKRDASLKN